MKRLKVESISSSTLFEMGKSEKTDEVTSRLNIARAYSEPGLYLGTSAFTANGWAGSFYPLSVASRDYLTHYATKFRTAEVYSTFYGTPSASTVTAWNEKAPPDFAFAAKIPQVITQEKTLVDSHAEFHEFISRMKLQGART